MKQKKSCQIKHGKGNRVCFISTWSSSNWTWCFQDKKLVESCCLTFSRLVEQLKTSPTMLMELCKDGLITNLQQVPYCFNQFTLFLFLLSSSFAFLSLFHFFSSSFSLLSFSFFLFLFSCFLSLLVSFHPSLLLLLSFFCFSFLCL